MTSADTIFRTKEQLHARGICIVIPTYNNAGTLRRVVEETAEYCGDIIVVNDGSDDETAAILKELRGITVVSHAENRGKGIALKSGFRKALERGFSYALTMDADGQHYAKDIPAFLAANKQYPGALIVGSRRLEGVDRSKGSAFANKFSNFWFAVQTWQMLPDTQTGYRLYPLKKLYGMGCLTSRYEAELELLVFSSWHGVRLVSIPVDVYYPPREERVTHFRPAYDFARISLLNTVLCLLAGLYGLPLRTARLLLQLLRTLYALTVFLFFSLIVFTPAVWLYVKAGRMTERKRMRLHRFIRHAARFVMIRHGIPGTKFTRSVHKDVDFDKPQVIICNHQSPLDLMCQLVFSPKVIFLTKDWVWRNPFFGLLIRSAEYLPVSRGIDEIMPQLEDLVSRGYSIAVYPEGTRSKDGTVGRFHQGAFHIAGQLRLGILPMVLYGTGKVLPKGGRLLRGGRMHIEVQKPVSHEELQQIGDYRKQASYFHHKCVADYERIANEIEQDA